MPWTLIVLSETANIMVKKNEDWNWVRSLSQGKKSIHSNNGYRIWELHLFLIVWKLMLVTYIRYCPSPDKQKQVGNNVIKSLIRNILRSKLTSWHTRGLHGYILSSCIVAKPHINLKMISWHCIKPVIGNELLILNKVALILDGRTSGESKELLQFSQKGGHSLCRKKKILQGFRYYHWKKPIRVQ